MEYVDQYVIKHLRQIWTAYKTMQRLKDPRWVPTWAILKDLMRESIGPAQVRGQMAYSSLKRAKQLDKQTPIELFNYMLPLWEEIGARNEAREICEYVNALRDDIRTKLQDILPEITTLAEAERRATHYWHNACNFAQNDLNQSKNPRYSG